MQIQCGELSSGAGFLKCQHSVNEQQTQHTHTHTKLYGFTERKRVRDRVLDIDTALLWIVVNGEFKLRGAVHW